MNTYAGGTFINAGVLSVSEDANLGATNGAINLNGGVLQITGNTFANTNRSIYLGSTGGGFDIQDSAHIFTVSQALSGTGGLVKEGAGTLVLTGANTYSGRTTVNNGVLQGNTSSLQGNITNNAAVVFDQADTGSYAGVMSGTGSLLKQNIGTLVLTGANTYSGGTTVDQGILSVNGSLASGVTVNANGTLRGIGTINGNSLIAGNLAPGNSPGNLTFANALTLTPTATLQIDIDGTGTGNGSGNYSRLSTGGVFTAAGRLNPVLPPNIDGKASSSFKPVIGQNFTSVNAAGGIAGTFSGLTQSASLPTGSRFDALYDSNTLRLAVTPGNYACLPTVTLSGNAVASGSALQAVRPAPYAAKNALFQSLAVL
jgi:autotransporter-associated beta strand protein